MHIILGAWLAALAVGAPALPAGGDQAYYAVFPDRGEAPPYRPLTIEERTAFDLGAAVFNTQWVIAGTPRAGRRDGLGPVLNAASCDACHNNGARGAAPEDSGELTASLVIQLAEGDRASARYGHVLNTVGTDGIAAEGKARVTYVERTGRYADGQAWMLRIPSYELYALRNGALHPDTVIKPRIAPALFGIGLLETTSRGRFGWQAESPSLADQTARALSREMGLHSALIPADDCGTADEACLAVAEGGSPEVSAEFMQALLAFQRLLAVPRPALRGTAADNAEAAALFQSTGCADCHRPVLPVEDVEGIPFIRAFTDLEVHDLGPDLADRDARGLPVRSIWRTAPLWGIGHSGRGGRIGPFLHDGRARSVEEAVLWHGGEASAAKERFGSLQRGQREALLQWLLHRRSG